MTKLHSEPHFVHLTKVRDPFNDLCEDLAVEIHENILRELGWDENTLLYAHVRMGEEGNVLVIERAKELDNGWIL